MTRQPSIKTVLIAAAVLVIVSAGILAAEQHAGILTAEESGEQDITFGDREATFGAGDTTVNRSASYLREGTEEETPVYIIRADRDGPTAFVVAGLHGDETAGYQAAGLITDWTVDAGTLIVIPEAYRPAVESGTRYGPDGDLNRDFPAGEEPESPLAREIWAVMEEYDPDLVLDIHTAGDGPGDIAGPDGEGGPAGQPMLPSTAGVPAEEAEVVATYLNENYFREDMPEEWHFEVAQASPDGSMPTIADKAAADLNTPSVVFTTYDKEGEIIPHEQQEEWIKAGTHRFLELYGLIDR